MTQAVAQPVSPTLPDRLRSRVEALGVTVACIEADGKAVCQSGCRWLEQMILGTPQFAAAVRRVWPQLSGNIGGIVPIWPGLWLAPLPSQRRRRITAEKFQPQVLAGVLLGEAFLSSDQFRLVCDAARVDAQVAAARVDARALFGEAEAARLASTLSWMQEDALEVDRRVGELKSMSNQLGESYEELSLLYKLSTSMTVDQPPRQFFTEACRELQAVVGLRWIALQLTDGDSRLNDLAGEVFTAGPVRCGDEELKAIGRQLMAHVPNNGQPLIIDDTAELNIAGLPGVSADLLIVPMLRESRPFGILFGGDKLDGSHLSSVDSKLCTSLAITLTIFLENVMLYEDMQAMFMGTLHALTSSIDAKDRYTHGHSERVALMSKLLAKAAGLSDEMCERVYVAGLVHDVGKIGVPEAVLGKPGKLTDEEFALIKLHPEIGARILRDIRQMQDLIPGVLYHHERWDGRGYPSKIAGENIPLFGRLICLADSFDAMSSNRTYRQALTLEQVLNEIRRCAGTQFDPQLAELFVNLDFAPFFELIEKHQRLAASNPGTAA